jgi:hypothetical protein
MIIIIINMRMLTLMLMLTLKLMLTLMPVQQNSDAHLRVLVILTDRGMWPNPKP